MLTSGSLEFTTAANHPKISNYKNWNKPPKSQTLWNIVKQHETTTETTKETKILLEPLPCSSPLIQINSFLPAPSD